MAVPDPTPSFDPAEIGADYTFMSNLGQGTFGKVICVRDARPNPDHENVAMKKVELLHSRLRFIRALREIRMMSRLRHDDVTTMYDVRCLPTEADVNGNVVLQAVYITMPLMTTDLASVLERSEARIQLTSTHRRSIFYQLLRGMKYVHSANVSTTASTLTYNGVHFYRDVIGSLRHRKSCIMYLTQLSHRDLKPSNLLINEACQIKICDFGLARVMDVNADGVSETTGPLTEKVQTLWYRAPELLFRSSIYDQSLDVWSVGCILAELLSDRVLFPGASTVDQIVVVVRTMGFPNAEDVQYYTDIHARFPVDLLRGTVLSARPWPRLFSNVAPDALDLLDRMLQYRPNARITIDEALHHAYVAMYREPQTEIVSDRPFENELNVGNRSRSSLQKLLLQWVTRYQQQDPDWDSTVLRNVN